MLFNSFQFLFVFLPLTLLGFAFFSRFKHDRAVVLFLLAASVVFYGWDRTEFVPIFVGSILCNFAISWAIVGSEHAETKRRFLILGVVLNLGLLGWYKYANFLSENLSSVFGLPYTVHSLALPLGISFFTFQQIAFLVDYYRGETRELDFPRYALFVAFFPHLIAGPLVHHSEMIRQFNRHQLHLSVERFSVGLSIFAIGLFKKVVIADNISVFVHPGFNAAASGIELSLLEAWGAALAYTFQIYFDFSAYSDMAVGLARLFGIRLPVNFFSPYKATSVIDFWRRWHITLSRFLRDYLYIPLGGNRRGPVRRYGNLLATMLLGGLWHGAGWTFIVWGGLHGFYLICNHAFRTLAPARMSIPPMAAGLLTFLAVVVAWVFFRASSMEAATSMLRGMGGGSGLILPVWTDIGWIEPGSKLLGMTVKFGPLALAGGLPHLAWLTFAAVITWGLPNVYQFMGAQDPALGLSSAPAGNAAVRWTPSPVMALALALVGSAALLQIWIGTVNEFLYFQF